MNGGQTVGKCAAGAGSKAVDDVLFAGKGQLEDRSATGTAAARTTALERCAVKLAAQKGKRRVDAVAVAAAGEAVEHAIGTAGSDRKDRSAAVAATAGTAAIDGRPVERPVHDNQVRFGIVSVVAGRKAIEHFLRPRGGNAKYRSRAVRAAAARVAVERAVDRGQAGERPEPVAAALEIVDDVLRSRIGDREDGSAAQVAAVAVRGSLKRRAVDRSVE